MHGYRDYRPKVTIKKILKQTVACLARGTPERGRWRALGQHWVVASRADLMWPQRPENAQLEDLTNVHPQALHVSMRFRLLKNTIYSLHTLALIEPGVGSHRTRGRLSQSHEPISNNL